jgi:hypothetical protein
MKMAYVKPVLVKVGALSKATAIPAGSPSES